MGWWGLWVDARLLLPLLDFGVCPGFHVGRFQPSRQSPRVQVEVEGPQSRMVLWAPL